MPSPRPSIFLVRLLRHLSVLLGHSNSQHSRSLIAILGRLLRLLSVTLCVSVKRLLGFLNVFRWFALVTQSKSFQTPDSSESQPPPPHGSTLLRSNEGYVFPSSALQAEQVTLSIPSHNEGHRDDGPYTTSIHSPSPTNSTIPKSVHLNAESRSSRVISVEEALETRSIQSRGSPRSLGRQLKPPGTSAVSLSPSTHGQRSTSPMPTRPSSRNSQRSSMPEIPKISKPVPPPRQPTPPPIATPSGNTVSRTSSPVNGLEIMTMSTATVKRWNRNAIV